MEVNEKSKILAQLSRSKSEKAVDALKIEAEKSTQLLLTDNDYVSLSHALDEMELYAFRIPEIIVDASKKFLSRLENEQIKFTFGGPDATEDYGADRLSSMLLAETINLLGDVRYHVMADVIELVIPYASSQNGTVNQAATGVLASCAKFDLDLYFGGENFQGLGAGPQMEILEVLESYSETDLLSNIDGFTTILSQLLSPNMEGNDWDYEKVTLKFGAVPASGDIEGIRQRAMALIFKAYKAVDQSAQKRSLLGTLFSAASTPSHGKVTSELMALIDKNTLEILEFLRSILPTEEMQIVQKIEHDTYWLHYHATSHETKASTLVIRDLIEKNKEYSIYKNLIGFEGIFDRWEDAREDRIDYKAIEETRDIKINEYVQSINNDNWDIWRARILDYTRTESNDLATFPKFYDFLEKLAFQNPDLALSLLIEDLDSLEFFTIPIFRGLWKSPLKGDCKKSLLNLVAKDQQLIAATKLFLSVDDLDHDIIDLIIERAIKTKNVRSLTELIGVACTRYADDPKYTVEGIFRPVLKSLNDIGSTQWIDHIWFNKEAQMLVSELSEEDRNMVLSALLIVDQISYRAEEILKPLVDVDPEGVIDLFGARIRHDDKRSNYQAVPFQFYKLHEGLSKHPDLLIKKIRSWYDAGDPLFQYRGGKFLAEIFPKFDEQFGENLIQLLENGNDEDARFVIEILRNYEGETFLHSVSRAIIIQNYEDKKIQQSLRLALLSTGVVSGEYGFAEAYETKITDIKDWLDDPDENVVRFAKDFTEMLEREAKAQRESADEEIALRKHRFGHKK